MTLEEQKQNLVAMRDELRKKVDNYTLWQIEWDGWYFKDIANKLYVIEKEIEKINKKLNPHLHIKKIRKWTNY